MAEVAQLVREADALAELDPGAAAVKYNAALMALGPAKAPAALLFNAAATFADAGKDRAADAAYAQALKKLPQHAQAADHRASPECSQPSGVAYSLAFCDVSHL